MRGQENNDFLKWRGITSSSPTSSKLRFCHFYLSKLSKIQSNFTNHTKKDQYPPPPLFLLTIHIHMEHHHHQWCLGCFGGGLESSMLPSGLLLLGCGGTFSLSSSSSTSSSSPSSSLPGSKSLPPASSSACLTGRTRYSDPKSSSCHE